MISLLEIAQSINEDPRGVDNIDRSKGAEKKDQDADRVGRDDGETWMAPNGDYGGKYKGEIEYFDDEDSAKVYAKSGSTDSKGGEEKPEEPKGNIGKGDFDRDFDDKDDKKPSDEPKGEPSGDGQKQLSPDEIDKKLKGLSNQFYHIHHSGMDPQTKQRYIDDLEKQRADLEKLKDEPSGEKPKDEPEGKLTSKGKKIQKSKEEFDDIIDDGAEPDDIGTWIEDNRYSLSGDGNPTKTMRAFSKLEDAFMDAEEDDDWDEYNDQLEDLKNSISKRLDTMVDLHREKPESDEPKGDKPKEKPQQTAADSREARNRVIKRIGRQAFDKLSYGEMQAEYEKELKAMGKRESIKVINGKKYKAVKEDRADGKKLVGYAFAGKVYKKKSDAPVSDPRPVYESKESNPRVLKEIYDRTFRSLK